MKLRLIAATAALGLVVSTAAAQPPSGPRLDRGPGLDGFGLLAFDANADGKLTKAEFDAGQRARFDKIDANRDGSITREERATHFKASAEARRAEATKARFADLDKDKNGQLSQSEFAAGGASVDGKGPDRHRSGGSMGDKPERVRADADKNAKISFADFSARGVEAFARADVNKDGTVIIAELQALKPPRR